jgi:hypothetical protein
MPQNPMKIFLALVVAATACFFSIRASAESTTQPTTQPDEKITVPEADLARIQEAAIFAETGNAAGLDWKPYYSAFMKLERRKKGEGERGTFLLNCRDEISRNVPLI